MSFTIEHPMRRALGAAGAALVVIPAACRTGGATPQQSARHASCQSADSAGTLQVSNNSGHLLEIHSWDATGQDRILGNASPGRSNFEVPGPSTLGMRYGVYDLASGQYYAIV